MTRILEALKKSRVPRRPSATATPVQPITGKVAAVESERPRGVTSSGAERAVRTYGHDLVRKGFWAHVEMPQDVLRELTALRMSIEAGLATRLPRTVMFMSAQSGEGTSTVACQFALATARDAGSRVLLMDVNARRPSPFVAATRESPHPGVQSIEQDMAPLDVMPVPESARHAGTIAAPVAREWIDALASQYDWIIMDGPPLLEAPDAAALATAADGVVIVIEAGRTKRPLIHRATDLLRKARANTLGSVLNRRRLEIPEFLYRRL